MKTILKTFLGLVGASLAAVSLLTVSAMAASNGTNSARSGLSQTQAGLWEGNIPSDDVKIYANSFSDPNYFSVEINGGKSSGTATTLMSANYGYYTNYKWASILVEPINGNISIGSTPRNDRNNANVSASISYGKNVPLDSIEYFGYLYNGDNDSSSYMERTRIKVYSTN